MLVRILIELVNMSAQIFIVQSRRNTVSMTICYVGDKFVTNIFTKSATTRFCFDVIYTSHNTNGALVYIKFFLLIVQLLSMVTIQDIE